MDWMRKRKQGSRPAQPDRQTAGGPGGPGSDVEEGGVTQHIRLATRYRGTLTMEEDSPYHVRTYVLKAGRWKHIGTL